MKLNVRCCIKISKWKFVAMETKGQTELLKIIWFSKNAICCPYWKLVMSNFNADFNIASISLIGFGLDDSKLGKNLQNLETTTLITLVCNFVWQKGFLLWRVTSLYREIVIRFSVISLNLSNFLACYVNTAYVTHKRIFHFAAILNFDACVKNTLQKIIPFSLSFQ